MKPADFVTWLRVLVWRVRWMRRKRFAECLRTYATLVRHLDRAYECSCEPCTSYRLWYLKLPAGWYKAT